MKRILLFALTLLFGVAFSAFAQPRAIGGRVGSGLEFSYQHTVGKNFIGLDAGLIYGDARMCNGTATFRVDGEKYTEHNRDFYATKDMVGVETVATYNWLFPIKAWKGKGEWNWYVGAGAGIGYMRCWDYATWRGTTYTRRGWDFGFAGVAARIGFEYNFWFPLQLSFDYRPLIGPAFTSEIVNGSRESMVAYNLTGLYAGAICFGVRYRF
ncbi:MAG: hypothetical protein MJ010_04825 [Paludibacteraceae bacterium]|nr:hypothetical protein [Paludibacteraceae bacterium]